MIKILVAEDDFISRRLLQKTLEDWGYEVVTANNGQEAWDIFQGSDILFVIADWIMPGIDGVSLCRKIRKSEMAGYVYFILLTSKGTKEDIIEGLDAGADDYLTKPFDRGELQVRVRAGERIIKLEKELTSKNEEFYRLNLRLEELIRIDPLMNIGNRRHFYEIIEKVHNRAYRYAHDYGVIMCDLDYFKAYNDIYGHLAGDNILKAVADVIKTTVRMSDDVFRFGGEEIVVILQEQDIETTTMCAERIRKAVELLNIQHEGSRNGIVTISCGVTACFTKECKSTSTRWENILEEADKAMYRAKSEGRNKVC